ncbi:MAG: response regulator transcription factor [Bacteroidales bacterium]|nr:response regulator transcription factor [Clostridium sp.]MCM1203394.1 response regulator transcription factor [Bacteroidales bacterium]
MTILVCDDDREIVEAISIYLKQEGYKVISAYNGREALAVMKEENIHLIILDIMMPELDGIHALLKLRESSSIPVILLSAKSEDADKILGLNVGADDYVTKPFNPLELVARVKSQLRRYTKLGGMETENANLLVNGSIALDKEKKTVTVDGEYVKLTPTEFKILELLMENLGMVFSSAQIYERIWGEDAYATDNIVSVHIRRIREKIEIDPKNPDYVKVMWGVGYRMEKKERGAYE